MELKNKLLETGLFIENDYLSKYCDLILNNLNNRYVNNEMQRHHVIPKSYYKYLGVTIDNSSNNIVNLLYKDHILAHYYLSKCASAPELSYANFFAIKFILNGSTFDDFDIDSIDLDVIQSNYTKSYKWLLNKSHDVEINKRISEKLTGRESPVKGKHFVEVRKCDLSKKCLNPKNKKLSDLAAERIGGTNPFYGKHHSSETKNAISAKNSKPVGMYKAGTDILLKSFKSVKAASDYLKLNNICLNSSSQSRICKVCKLCDKTSIAYGYNWRYLDKV